ncbi:GntR family transcriptional regulator [Streptomyces pini]|uniref:GntR family transcriptional regulator n=1 Tax=Streptomyces pini TaxID=1520580 RepID=A0A1I4MDY9_9ACTN|nr:GntR family transcriptional regulator [Streptomyces pini]SFM01461.1 GntR family transcriptional regulator [Streptomyces pini]
MPELDRTPPYLQVVHELKRRIVDGELNDGDRLPSVRQIADQWGIAQATAMKALAALRADGLAESVTGVGTVVRSRRNLHRSAVDRLERALSTGKIYPDGEYAVIKAAELSTPPTWVADLLELEEGAHAIRRHRVTYNEEGPVSASTSWFSPALAETVPALLQTDRIPGGTPNAIEAATGRRGAAAEEATAATRATERDAEELGVEVGSPVLAGRNIYFDTEGGIIEVGESVAPEGRWRIHRRNG